MRKLKVNSDYKRMVPRPSTADYLALEAYIRNLIGMLENGYLNYVTSKGSARTRGSKELIAAGVYYIERNKLKKNDVLYDYYIKMGNSHGLIFPEGE